jgi:hypothetical protein
MVYSIKDVHQVLMHVKKLEQVRVLNYVLQLHSIIKKKQKTLNQPLLQTK